MPHSSSFENDVASVRDLVDRAAEVWADETLLIAPESGATLSFRGLRRRSLRLARHLRRLGLGAGDRVALACDNGSATVELLLGSMYGGFVPVPLNVTSGSSALADVLAHSGARVLFAGGEWHPLAESAARGVDHHIRVLSVDADGPVAGEELEADEEALPPSKAGDDALLIYTSGSTGRPKGVLFTQRNILACGWNSVHAHELERDDRFLCVLPLYHMNSVDKLLGVLSSGGSMVLPRRFELTSYWGWVTQHGCTWLALVPTLVSQLTSRPGPEGASLDGVRFARSSSAALADEQRRAFEEKFGLPLLEGMGMTEAGGIFLNPVPPKPRKAGSLGVPQGLEVRVVDEHGRERGAGEAGEMLVRGPSVMKGYYKDADATADVLDEDGWLYTGDRGYRDDEGIFFHAGRLKELIIKAGTNIAPREVEDALEAHPAVREAAVVGVPDAYLGEEIVAHVILERAGRCDERELLQHCEERLGTLKTPARIEFADDLPRGPSGKVLRAPLRDRSQQPAVQPREGPSATRSDIEQVLSRVWAEALGRETVDVHDDFFAVGGYSLLALRILSRVKQELSVEIPLGYFVEAPTIAEQAGIVERELQGGAGSGGSSAHERRPGSRKLNAVLLAPIHAGCTSAPLFCLYGLSRYRFLARLLGPDQPTYGLWTEQELGIASPDGLPPRFPSVAELAEAYLEDVRAIQPSGPYHLVGASFGGRVALEMAHLLYAQGEEVALIAALDTYLPDAATWRPFRWFTYHLGRSLRKGPGYVIRVLREKARKRRTRARIRQGAPVDAEGISLLAREGEFRTQARARHRVRPYAGKIALFRAMDAIWYSPGYRVDPLLGWGEVAQGGLDVHDVPGSHMGILEEPNVRVLADSLRPYLQGPK